MNMTGFYDMHTHILPAVDDGAASVEMTRQMLQKAFEQGIRHIMATPHYIQEHLRVDQATLLQRYQLACKEAWQISPDMHIYLGNELYYSDSVLEDVRKGKANTLADSDYILIEFPVNVSWQGLYQGLRKSVGAGYRPVLAHMERYECLYRREERLDELAALGVYLQMNADSVMGGILDNQAANCRRLIKEGRIHLLGSDCHNMTHRPQEMLGAVEYLRKKKVPEDVLERILFRNPQQVLANKYI